MPLVACTTTSSPMDAAPPPDIFVPASDQATAAAYPTAMELWGGAQGIYRGCGPNGNVCHNARQYPNMNSLEAFTWNVGRPCNQLQSDPTSIDDWCERAGDLVSIGGMDYPIAYMQQLGAPTDTVGGQWQIVLQSAAPMLTSMTDLSIVHINSYGHRVTMVQIDAMELVADPGNPNVIDVQLGVMEADTEAMFESAGVVGDPEAIQFGDPNRNGIYGASIGALLINPGHPELSYIIKRLTNPMAGPLMPLANCCFWTKASLRALWCWIATLHPDGSNALDPIDYGNCPPGPVENVVYPDPGPNCGVAGVCPVHEASPVPTDPTWDNIYQNIITPNCAGFGCHFDSAAGGLDMHSSQSAYDSLLNSVPPRVIPGDPANSKLYQRITQTCTPGHICTRMPYGRDPLPDAEIMTIYDWIEMGASMGGDAGATVDAMDESTVSDATPEAAVDSGVDESVDVGTDAGGMDVMDNVAPDADDAMDAAADSGG